MGTGARFIHLWAQHIKYLNVTPEGVGRDTGPVQDGLTTDEIHQRG